MMIHYSAILTLLVFSVCLASADSEPIRIKNGYICNSHRIACNGGLLVSIVNATFGSEGRPIVFFSIYPPDWKESDESAKYLTGNRCGPESIGCTTNVTSVLQEQCQCKAFCEISVSQSNLRNSCPGTHQRNFMTLSFVCLQPTIPICNPPTPTTTSLSLSSSTSSLPQDEVTPSKSNNTLIALAVVLVVVVILTIIFVWMCIKKKFQCTFNKLVTPEEHVYDVVLAEMKPPNQKGVFRLREQSEGDDNARRRLVHDPLPETNNVVREETLEDNISQAPTLPEISQDVYNEIFPSRKASDRENTQEAQLVYNELYVPKEIYEETFSRPVVYNNLNASEYTFADDEDEPNYNELTHV